MPRDHWLTDDEKERIILFARANPLEGYRRMTFMMIDANQVACSPASVYRVLKAAGLLAGDTPNAGGIALSPKKTVVFAGSYGIQTVNSPG